MKRDIISFSMRLAEKVGFENAGFLQDIYFWMGYNKSSNTCFFNDRYWTFSTQEELCARHPYWTRKQIQRIIKNCKDSRWLLVDNYSKNPYDRTNWYSLSDEITDLIQGNSNNGIGAVDSPKRGNVECPKQGNDINEEDCPKKNDNIYTSLFDEFWRLYPRRVGKTDAFKVWKKLNPDDTLLSTMIIAINKQKQTEQWQNEKFIPYPATWLSGRRWEDEIPEPKDGRKNDGFDDFRNA